MDKLINKIGVDKIMHFLVGAFIAFTINTLAILQEGCAGDWMNVAMCTCGVICAAIIAFWKEAIIDGKWNWWDFIATILGACTTYIFVALGTFLYIASN